MRATAEIFFWADTFYFLQNILNFDPHVIPRVTRVLHFLPYLVFLPLRYIRMALYSSIKIIHKFNRENIFQKKRKKNTYRPYFSWPCFQKQQYIFFGLIIFILCSTHNFTLIKFLHATFGPPYVTDILYLTLLTTRNSRVTKFIVLIKNKMKL